LQKIGTLMKSGFDRFRIAISLIALTLSWFAFATIFAETFTPKTQQFSQDTAVPDASSPDASYGSFADWAAAAAPLRGDLLADVAMAHASPTLKLGKVTASSEILATREGALATARQSLSLAPHSSSMWPLMAMLETNGQKGDSGAEPLKMP
jgi:hypothetical protein